MAELADALGVSYVPFTHPGPDGKPKEYRLGRLKAQHYAMFEAWVEAEAMRGAERARRVGEPIYRDMVAQVSRDIAAQRYAFGSDAYVAASQSVAGLKELFRLSLFEQYPECSAAWVQSFVDAHSGDDHDRGILEVKRLMNLANQREAPP